MTSEKGFFGEFGGQFVPEAMKVALNEVADAFEKVENDQ